MRSESVQEGMLLSGSPYRSLSTRREIKEKGARVCVYMCSFSRPVKESVPIAVIMRPPVEKHHAELSGCAQ